MGAAQPAMKAGPASPGNTRKKVLVTGGSGLLGRPLLKELIDRNFAVTSLSAKSWQNKHPKVQALFHALGVESYTLDLSVDVEQAGQGLRQLIQSGGFDLVINLAADRGGIKYDGTKMTMNNHMLNTQLPACLADIAAELGVPVFLISTEYVWSGRGNTEEGYPAVPVGSDDRFVNDAGAPYAVQKRKAEALAGEKRVRLATGDSITIIRLPVLYGELISPLEDGTATQSIQNFLTENTWKHDTWQQRYPTFAGDAASTIAALARKRLSVGLQYSIYNYGAQNATSKYDFMAIFATEADFPVEYVQPQDASTLEESKRPPFDVRLDIHQTREELLSVDDWCEPRGLDGQIIRDLFFGIFADGICAKREELDKAALESWASCEITRQNAVGRRWPRNNTLLNLKKDHDATGIDDNETEKTAISATARLALSVSNVTFQRLHVKQIESRRRCRCTGKLGRRRTWLV